LEHAWLFRDGLVEGALNGNGVRVATASAEALDNGVHILPLADASIEDTVEWAVNVILEEVTNKAWLEPAESEADVESVGQRADERQDEVQERFRDAHSEEEVIVAEPNTKQVPRSSK